MGCCQSTPVKEPNSRSRSEAAPIPDACYPDKIGFGGVKVLASTASTPGSRASQSGRTHTRLVVGPDWIFAALFEAHGGSDASGSREAAARFCAQHCYTEFQRATDAAALEATGSDDDHMCNVLMATFKALDRRYLSDDGVLPQDRLASGCTGVLLHVSIGENPRATAASVGPCAAVVGQRRGGLASATSAPKLLCGGEDISHHALQDFLATLAPPQPLEMAFIPKKPKSLKKNGLKTSASAHPQLAGVEPEYTSGPAAPHALGFGCAKGLRLRLVTAVTAADELRPEPVVGLDVRTAFHELGASDDCLVLLSSGAAAGIAPADVALLMHRMGLLAAIPYDTKPRPLLMEASSQVAVQLDNLGVAGPRAAEVAPAVPSIVPFNAARLLVQHAASTAAARGPNASGDPVGVMAFALEWPRASDDSAAASAACGASVAAVRAAAAAAANSQHRAQYRWQLLRLYYKYPHKRHMAIINRWHEIFDRVLGEGRRTANLKEAVAWLRLGAAVKVSAAGNVQCLTSRENEEDEQPVQQEQHQQQPYRTSPVPNVAATRQHRSASARVTSSSPMRGTVATRPRSRSPAPGAYQQYSTPGVAAAASAHTRPPMSAGGTAGSGARSPYMKSVRQASSPPPSSPTRSASAREPAAASTAARRDSLAVSSPKRPSRVGLLEAEGIVLGMGSRNTLRGQELKEGGCEVLSISNPARTSRTSSAGDGFAAAAAADADASGLPSEADAVDDATEHLAACPYSEEVVSTLCEGDIIGGPKATGDGAAVCEERGSSTIASATANVERVAASVEPPVASMPSSTEAAGEGLAAAPNAPSSSTATTAITAAPFLSSSHDAAMTTVPALEVGSSQASSLVSGVDASDGTPLTSRSTGRGSPRSRIPSLQLKPHPALAATGAAAVHATPRLSLPGGNATPGATPPTRASSTWGGAGPTTPSSTAPNSARSGSSRLPRPPNTATPATGGSISRPTVARPPRLDVGSSMNGPQGLAAAPPTLGNESDLFSPDAEQLAAWAMEAVDAIGSAVKDPEQKTPQQQRGLDPGPASTNSKAGLSASFGGPGSSGGGRRPLASRIPLSPRADFNNTRSNNAAYYSKQSSRTTPRGSEGQSRGQAASMRSPSTANMGRSTDVATPRRAASDRFRR